MIARSFRGNLAAILAVDGIAVTGLAWEVPSLVEAAQDERTSVVLLSVATSGRDLLLPAVTDLFPVRG